MADTNPNHILLDELWHNKALAESKQKVESLESELSACREREGRLREALEKIHDPAHPGNFQVCECEDHASPDCCNNVDYFCPTCIAGAALDSSAPLAESKNEWKEAVIEACVVNCIGWDETNPVKTLTNLISWEVQIALDPAVSGEAAKLRDTYKNNSDVLSALKELKRRVADEQSGSNELNQMISELEIVIAAKESS